MAAITRVLRGRFICARNFTSQSENISSQAQTTSLGGIDGKAFLQQMEAKVESLARDKEYVVSNWKGATKLKDDAEQMVQKLAPPKKFAEVLENGIFLGIPCIMIYGLAYIAKEVYVGYKMKPNVNTLEGGEM